MSRIDHISQAVHGGILELILTGSAVTRSSLIEATRLARGTLTDRLGALLESGLIREGHEPLRSSGGRPARTLGINPDFGYVLTAEIGETGTSVAVTDLTPKVLAEDMVPVDMKHPPERSLVLIAAALEALLERLPSNRPVLGIGVSLPVPVDARAGCVLAPSIMSRWDNLDIAAWFEARLGVPAYLEKDVNLLALAEHRAHWPQAKQFLFIKADTGIGSGIMHNGHIYRGAQGSSGDIGHVQLRGGGMTQCRCGKTGCLEALAGGWALARDLRAQGFRADDVRDIVAMVEAQQPRPILAVRNAGLNFGEIAADLVNILNPDVIVLGGPLARAGTHILDGITAVVQARCLLLATRTLKIATARLNDRAGLLGAAHLVIHSRICSKRIGALMADCPREPRPAVTRALDLEMTAGGAAKDHGRN